MIWKQKICRLVVPWTKLLSKCQGVQWQQLVFDRVYHWQCVATRATVQHQHMCTREYTPPVILTHAQNIWTHTPPPQKRGKTCRHGRLSKQLQQIETKLNLKPRATAASERLWQIWQGRKGSAADQRVGEMMERAPGVGHKGFESYLVWRRKKHRLK